MISRASPTGTAATHSSCTACATAKRRCGRQQPRCQRCWSRGIDCQYPPPKPQQFVALTTHDASILQQPGDILTPFGKGGLSLGVDLAGLPIDTSLASWWFSSPETWEVDHRPRKLGVRQASSAELEYAVPIIRDWLAQWVQGDCNPFIHHELYRHRFPSCIQDAYMALSCYLHRTRANEQTVLRIIYDKATQLVAQHAPNSTTTPPEAPSVDSSTHDPFIHLARSQALLIYQLISLYDGNTVLRDLAETHIPVLRDWLHNAILHASETSDLGTYLTPSASSPSNVSFAEAPTLQVHTESWQQTTWHAWILSESLRRTFLVASAAQGIYLSHFDGIAHCLGGMMFTSRRGFWDAPTAAVWLSRCKEVYGGLVRLTEMEKLFETLEPRELDDFARVMLGVTFGAERVGAWGVDVNVGGRIAMGEVVG
ncbi:MAG: hypothetical protein Q9162_002287 [Coniocarpon cinnabarinum]